MILLKAHEVVKQFANHLALDHVSISVRENSVFGLLGPNGAGKTTLIRIINQITGPDSGEVFLSGKKLEENDVVHIGYMPEERGLYRKMKVGEQAMYLARLKGVSKVDAKKKLKLWFEKFEIMEWWDKKIEELSKGMQQKVQFITTVLHEPKLLIFDEPFSGFDPINTELLKTEILQLKERGATVIFSTHNMASVEEVCDDIALINNSKVVLTGNVNEVKERYRSNTVQLEVGSQEQLPADYFGSAFLIQQQINVYKGNRVTVHLAKGQNLNDLLKIALGKVEVKGVNLVVPSMHEIFIGAVRGTQESRNV